MGRILRTLLAAIDADTDCKDWLRNPDQAISYILGAMPGTPGTMMVGVGSFSDRYTNAVAGTAGTDMAPGSMLITMNLNGAFFNPDASVGYGVPSTIKAASSQAQALLLLHCGDIVNRY
jgi:hypothetical protein